jgi:hypothetical protein
MANKMIINTVDGTVTYAQQCVVVDVRQLSGEGLALYHEWVEGGNDGDAIELGKQYGTKIDTEQAVA